MKKIGVVSDVRYDVDTNKGENIYVSNLKIDIYNFETKVLNQIKIECEKDKYASKNNNILYLGDIIEYDTELKSIKKVEDLTEEKIKEIDIYKKKYIGILEILKEPDFVSSLAKCSNIEEVKQIACFLKRTSKFEQHIYKIKIKNILLGMSENLKLIENIRENPIHVELSTENLKIILTRLDARIKVLYDTISSCDYEEEDLNKLLTSYMMYKYYEAIVKSKNLDNILSNNLVDLKEVKRLLTQKDMLPIKINNKVKELKK